MTSTTTASPYPPKAKSLTLLELCQTLSELRNTTSRNTAQILTRRLYLHPLTISSNAKHHSSRLIANNLLETDELNQINAETKDSIISKHRSCQDLSILSSSFPLSTRVNTRPSVYHPFGHENPSDFEASRSTLPSINRNLTSSSTKRSLSNRSSFISIQQKAKASPATQAEKIDVWRSLARTLQRPVPKDPPTTPLDIVSDFQLHNSQ